jgi:hypothetical protein
MIWTDRTPILHIPFGDIMPRVRANAVENVHLAVAEINGEEEAIDIDTLPGPFRQFINIAKTCPRHGS